MYTVEQIHADFYEAEERLLSEAKELLKDPQLKKAQYAERVSKLGFTSAKPVKDATEMATAFLAAEERIKSIEYYRVYYPNNKFITEAEVKKLCEKYSLLLGNAANYTGDIPEKNLSEIEAFSLRKEDWTEKSTGIFSFINLDWGALWSDSNMLGVVSGKPRRTGALSQYFERVNNQISIGMGLLPAIQSTPVYETRTDPYKNDAKEKEQAAFKICAPKEDFNTLGYEVKDGYILVYDPIVLQPVKDGYLIISAWGQEGNDELIVNQHKN